MKKFVFSLERVLEWRRTQVRVEEMNLERLHREHHELESRMRFLAEESGRVKADLVRGGRMTGADLEALDRFRKSAASQIARVATAIQDAERRIGAQMQVVTEKRRDVKLIEQLREKKFGTWRREFLKEIDQQAEEAHLARFSSPLS